MALDKRLGLGLTLTQEPHAWKGAVGDRKAP